MKLWKDIFTISTQVNIPVLIPIRYSTQRALDGLGVNHLAALESSFRIRYDCVIVGVIDEYWDLRN